MTDSILGGLEILGEMKLNEPGGSLTLERQVSRQQVKHTKMPYSDLLQAWKRESLLVLSSRQRKPMLFPAFALPHRWKGLPESINLAELLLMLLFYDIFLNSSYYVDTDMCVVTNSVVTSFFFKSSFKTSQETMIPRPTHLFLQNGKNWTQLNRLKWSLQ